MKTSHFVTQLMKEPFVKRYGSYKCIVRAFAQPYGSYTLYWSVEHVSGILEPLYIGSINFSYADMLYSDQYFNCVTKCFETARAGIIYEIMERLFEADHCWI